MKKNPYATALKYEAMYNDGIEAICRAINPTGFVSENIAWMWIERNEKNNKALKGMLKILGYAI